MVCEKKNRSSLFSGSRKKPDPHGPLLSGKLGSRWNGGPRGSDFPVPTEHLSYAYLTWVVMWDRFF